MAAKVEAVVMGWCLTNTPLEFELGDALPGNWIQSVCSDEAIEASNPPSSGGAVPVALTRHIVQRGVCTVACPGQQQDHHHQQQPANRTRLQLRAVCTRVGDWVGWVADDNLPPCFPPSRLSHSVPRAPGTNISTNSSNSGSRFGICRGVRFCSVAVLWLSQATRLGGGVLLIAVALWLRLHMSKHQRAKQRPLQHEMEGLEARRLLDTDDSDEGEKEELSERSLMVATVE